MPQRARIARIAVPISLLSAPAGARETRHNLTTIETAFDEKRPFFVVSRRMLEGGSIDADTRYFYTRRVGAIPRQTAGQMGRTP
jgi:hypothetical protein